MATINGFIRSYGAAVKRIERNQKKREAAKRFKEQQKQREFQSAVQAVNKWNEYVQKLKSIHKEASEKVDWTASYRCHNFLSLLLTLLFYKYIFVIQFSYFRTTNFFIHDHQTKLFFINLENNT